MKFYIESGDKKICEWSNLVPENCDCTLKIPAGVEYIDWIGREKEEKLIDPLEEPVASPDFDSMSLDELLDYYSQKCEDRFGMKRYVCQGSRFEEEEEDKYPTLLVIPGSVKSIKAMDYDILTNIKEIVFEGTLAQWCSMDKMFLEHMWYEELQYELFLEDEDGNFISINNLEIPSSIHEIKDYCFTCCTNLKHITIGSSVIGYGAFTGCSNLETVSIMGSSLEICGEWDDSFFEYPFDDPDISVTLSEEIVLYMLDSYYDDSAIEGLLNMHTVIDETGESLQDYLDQREEITLKDLENKGINTCLPLSEQFRKYFELECDTESDYGYMEDVMREEEEYEYEDCLEEVGFSIMDPNDLWEIKGVLDFNDYEEFDQLRWW